MEDMIDLLVGLLAGISLALIVAGLVVFGSLFYLSREPAHRRFSWSARVQLPRAIARLKDRRVSFRWRRMQPARIGAHRMGVRT